MEMGKHLIEDIKHVSLSMFNKNFFGVYHGSISARVSTRSFIINKKDTILDEVTEESLIRLDCQKKDYRWDSASSDVEIHEHIYRMISSAKYISYTMPPYATAFSLKHGKVLPQDYFGKKILGDILVYDPKNFDDWQERAPYEIPRFFQKNDSHLLLIKGFGLISYDRDIIEMAKKVAILENSCRLLALSSSL
jgi:L-fuculose-phosphate aldolase